jgi:signal transduction histidine kinase/tetratricopeptide (TPR) repeat protein
MPSASEGVQPSRADSLEQVYENESLPDSARYTALQKMTFTLIFSDGTSARQKIKQGLKIIERSSGKSEYYYNLYQNLGIYYDVNQEIDSAKAVFSEILEESKNQGWDELEQRSYNNLGMNSLNSSHYRKAIEYFSSALNLSRKNPAAKGTDYVNYLSNLGLANQELELYDQAIKYHLEALDIRRNVGDINGMAISYANLGICSRQIGEFDKGISYYESAIENAEAAGNRTQYHRVHDNLGSLYLGIGDYDKGLEMLETALDTSDGYSLDPKMKLSIFSNMTTAYVDLDRLKDAENYAQLGLNELEEYPDLINYSLTLFDALAAIHFKKGEFDQGSGYLEKYRSISKEVYSAENAELLTDLQVQYELAKKENQIALQNAVIQEKNAVLQRNYFALAAFGLLLFLLIAALIHFQNRNKRRQELLVKDRELQIKEAYLRATTESQEQERRRIAQDLHDGFGQFISALRLYVSQLKSDLTREEIKSELITRTDLVLDEMSKEISTTVYNLMPTTLITYGLVSALGELAERVNAGKKIQIELKTEGIQERQSELFEINLFRICQEWINNVLKYAGAKNILISLLQNSENITLLISDDGDGFDTDILEHSERNGWKNINTRVGLLDATLELNSRLGVKGTDLLVKFPHIARSIKETVNV